MHHTPSTALARLEPPEKVHVKTGYGHVGQGRTPEAAQAALMENIRQSRER